MKKIEKRHKPRFSASVEHEHSDLLHRVAVCEKRIVEFRKLFATHRFGIKTKKLFDDWIVEAMQARGWTFFETVDQVMLSYFFNYYLEVLELEYDETRQASSRED